MIKAALLIVGLVLVPISFADAAKKDTMTTIQDKQYQTIDINQATIKELTMLPGIGERKAKAIFNFREEHGPFDNLDALLAVKGVGKGIVSKLEGKVKF